MKRGEFVLSAYKTNCLMMAKWVENVNIWWKIVCVCKCNVRFFSYYLLFCLISKSCIRLSHMVCKNLVRSVSDSPNKSDFVPVFVFHQEELQHKSSNFPRIYHAASRKKSLNTCEFFVEIISATIKLKQAPSFGLCVTQPTVICIHTTQNGSVVVAL